MRTALIIVSCFSENIVMFVFSLLVIRKLSIEPLVTLSVILFAIIRWNVSAGAARPNPQGSFKYGQINVTDVYVLKNKPPVVIDGKRKTTLNGISYSAPSTPLRLADQFHVKGVYKLDFPTRPLVGSPQIGTSVINGTYRGFMEVIFQNNDTTIQSYHMDGYAFFVVGYGSILFFSFLFLF